MVTKKKKSVADTFDKVYEEVATEVLEANENDLDQKPAVTEVLDNVSIELNESMVGDIILTEHAASGGYDKPPVIRIAGKNIDTKEIDRAEFFKLARSGKAKMFSSQYGGSTGNTSPIAIAGNYGRYDSRIPIEETKYYVCKVNSRLILATSGSSLILDVPPMTAGDYDEWGDVGMGYNTGNEVASIVLIYSAIYAESIQVAGTCWLNNSTVSVDTGSALFNEVNITASSIRTRDRVDLYKVWIKQSMVHANYIINMRKSRLHNLRITGVSQTSFTKVENYSEGYFEIGTWGGNIEGHGLNVHGCLLADFRYSASTNGSQLKRYENTNPNRGVAMRVDRRLDYGQFSSIKPLNFVRFCDEDLIIEGEIFKASSFLTVPHIDKNVEDPYPRPASPFGTLNVNPFVGESEVRTRLGRLIFGYAYGRSVETDIHRLAIDSVYDQIRSRVRLYSQLNALLKQS